MSALTSAQRTVRQAADHPVLEFLARAGLAGFGVLHLAVAWVVLLIATGEPAAEGDHSGAFRVLAEQPLGGFLVWGITIGLAAMIVWQAIEAAVGHLDESGRRRTAERLLSVGRVLLYSLLAWKGYGVAIGEPKSGAQEQKEATAGLLGETGGQFLVGLIGVAVVVGGGVMIWYGLTRQFERKLRVGQMSATVHRAALTAGKIGYGTKGVAYGTAGVLLVVAAATYSPERSTGLDGALRTLADQPFGSLLLTLIALGFAVYGVFCLVQARYRKV
jgi:hypothetical protein